MDEGVPPGRPGLLPPSQRCLCCHRTSFLSLATARSTAQKAFCCGTWYWNRLQQANLAGLELPFPNYEIPEDCRCHLDWPSRGLSERCQRARDNDLKV